MGYQTDDALAQELTFLSATEVLTFRLILSALEIMHKTVDCYFSFLVPLAEWKAGHDPYCFHPRFFQVITITYIQEVGET